jgi:hypothetical protein
MLMPVGPGVAVSNWSAASPESDYQLITPFPDTGARFSVLFLAAKLTRARAMPGNP